MSSVTGAASQFAGMATSPDERAGAGLGKSVSAWRRVFEREQMAALAEFRSVPTGSARGMGAYSAPCGQPDCAVPVATDGPLTLSGHASPPGRESANAILAKPAPYSHFLNTVKPSMPAGERWAGVWGGQMPAGLPSAEAVQVPLASAALHQAALTSSGEWPWRRLHCMVDANGVHVWLRDTTIGAEDDVLLEWLGQLLQALAQSGARLASFTLNGTAISPIA
jgi:hypothetical protein